MIAGPLVTETKSATEKVSRPTPSLEALEELVMVLENSNANFCFPGDLPRYHRIAPYDHPTKSSAEESKKRRKMAARSRKLNRKGK
jgi:hypothetical protein